MNIVKRTVDGYMNPFVKSETANEVPAAVEWASRGVDNRYPSHVHTFNVHTIGIDYYYRKH